MGTKYKLQDKILSRIKELQPKATHFYDLFGGGGSISFKALEYFENVHYNELSSGVVQLLRKIQQDGVTPEFYEFISHKDFYELRGGDSWKSGLQQTCYSFGSRGTSYLYAKDKERIKRLFHEVIVNDSLAAKKELTEFFGIDFVSFQVQDDKKETRLSLQRFLNAEVNNSKLKEFQNTQGNSVRNVVQNLERIETLENLEELLATYQSVKRNCSSLIDNLNRIEHLIEVEEHINPLNITNLSYEEVPLKIPENSVIYCDIPYEDTKEYQECNFNHKEFYEWCMNSDYTIFVSSYEAPLYEIQAFNHRSSQGGAYKQKEVIEKLFCNKPLEIQELKIDDW